MPFVTSFTELKPGATGSTAAPRRTSHENSLQKKSTRGQSAFLQVGATQRRAVEGYSKKAGAVYNKVASSSLPGGSLGTCLVLCRDVPAAFRRAR